MLLLALLLVACRPGSKTPGAAPASPTPPATLQATASPTPVERTPVVVSPVGLDGSLVAGTDGNPWWNDSVFYEIFVRSFYDSDGDGVGDIRGLIAKLDYLNDGKPDTGNDLGVTGLWLMPVTQSPSYHGYDVADYYRIDDEYGTNEDFKRLMQEAHARGIRVIVDLVLNHTSAQHPWFQESLDPASARRDWYVWSDHPRGEGWHAGPSGYYYGYFWDQMPDLNYDNPEVTEAMQAVTRFWLEDMGADGFRLDAIKHLDEDGPVRENTPGTHTWLQGFHTFYKAVNPQALVVGEVWSTTSIVAQYIGDEVDLAFEFNMANAILQSVISSRNANVQWAQQKALDSYPSNQFATFLANHDQNRARSRLLNDEQAKLAATLQLAFCGLPFIYYGEEIGMQGTKPDEDIRRPMQWGPDGGFSAGSPWHAYFEDYRQRHVAGQSAEPASLLKHYQALIHLRNTHEALRIGDCQLVKADPPSVHALLRTSNQESVLVVVNLGRKPVGEYSLSLPAGPLAAGSQPAQLMGSGPLYAPVVNEVGGFEAYRPLELLPAYSSLIIQFVPPVHTD
ncbi:MAG: hypothetical protein JW850_16340 [Thermoflexales bacterium]|nr:hypothetical protein [Thermoflexales bacterium]